MTPGDIEAAAPPVVEPGAHRVVVDRNTIRPYDVALSAPFSIR